MAACPTLPNELMLLLFKHQTTVPDLLALSSTSHAMRSLFLDNTSGILSEACKNTNLLSAAKALVDTIFEIAELPTHLCECAIARIEPETHFHKNVSNQRHIIDSLAPFPAELRAVRSLSRAIKFARLVAYRAFRFWTTRAKDCPVDHEPLDIDEDKVAQIYLLLWVCAESHFSPDHIARATDMIGGMPKKVLAILWQVYELYAYDMDTPTKLILGIEDPNEFMDDNSAAKNGVMLDVRGDRLDRNEDTNMNFWQWCVKYTILESATGKRHRDCPSEIFQAWLSARPEGCTCHKAVRIKWDLVQIEWWHAWNRTLNQAS